MADVKVYECVSCGNTVEIGEDESRIPECCGKPMKPVEELKACPYFINALITSGKS